ncbi:hypothetical protein [Pseudonocardia nigra]|uniref:hypothetical protein n=1 Tax=Pseudonocardia nigra TaxID=1921578 RepID=UPI001C5EF18A|nr:hypothetical protein [Pseudonocardia nigra]
MDDDVAADDLAELRAAASVADLHRLLVTRQVSGRSTRHQEAVELFVLHHREDPVGAVDTAVLLCTEWRWNRCTAKLIADICAAGILDDDALDALADRLLWADQPSVRHPLSWLGLGWMSIDPASGHVVGRGTDRDRLIDHQRSPAEPPLLRWAAGHLLCRKRTTVDRLRSRAASLDSRRGPAVLAGALDAADSLTHPDLQAAIDLGLTSGRAQVRKLALHVMADRIDPAEAVRLARIDPDASIRRWAPILETESSLTPATLF